MRITYIPSLGTSIILILLFAMVEANQCRTMVRRTRRHEVFKAGRMDSNQKVEELLNKLTSRDTSAKFVQNLSRRAYANIDYVTLFAKNRMYLEILSDGTVMGTRNSSSDFVILRRTLAEGKLGTVHLKGVAANKFLCLSKCGMLYGTTIPNDDCRFLESIEENMFDTYTSPKQSKKKQYVAMAANGCPCLLRINATTNATRDGRGSRSPHLGSKSDFVLFLRTPYKGKIPEIRTTPIINKTGSQLPCPVKCKVPVSRKNTEKKRHACSRCKKAKNPERCKKECHKEHHNHNRTVEKLAVTQGARKRKRPPTTPRSTNGRKEWRNR